MSQTLTKIDVARRQINAAIRMLFDKEDPIPIHTLTLAAFRILRDLSKNKSLEWDTTIKSCIVPGKEKEFWNAISFYANFFKHADNDPDDVVPNLSDSENDHILFITIRYYKDLRTEISNEMKVMHAMCLSIYPHIINADAPDDLKMGLTLFGWTNTQTRDEQLGYSRELLETLRKSTP